MWMTMTSSSLMTAAPLVALAPILAASLAGGQSVPDSTLPSAQRTRSAQLSAGVAGLAGMAVSLARSVERSRQAWLSYPLPAPLLGLASERRASVPGPRRGVAQKRGASSGVIPGIGRARHGLHPPVAEGDASHDGGNDRGGSAQGLPHGGGDQRRRTAAGPAARASLGCAGRAAAGVGAGLARAGLGGGRRRRDRSSAGPATAVRR